MTINIVSLTSRISKDNKNVLANIGLSFIVKGGSLIVTLFTIPSYMRYFDNRSVLGVWFTILSVLSWILAFDFGIGNGLRNQLVPALVEHDTDKQRKLISSAYISLFAISFILLLIVLIASQSMNWNIVFNINEKTIPSGLLRDTVIVCLISIVLQFFLRLITSILYALQYSFLPNLLSFLSTTFLLIFINIFILCGHKNDFFLLAWVNLLSVNVPLIIATFALFLTKMKKSFPSVKHFDLKLSAGIFKYGIVFLWLQLMALIINSTNDFLITFLIGPSQDVPYQAYTKIFTLISGIVTLALIPIWSAVTKAKAENRYRWIRKVYLLLLLLVMLVFILYLLCMPMLQTVFNLWLGKNTIKADYFCAFVFVIFATVNIWSGVLATFVNGLSDLKIQMVFLTFGAIVNIPLACLFVHLNNSFISIVAANIGSLLPFCVIQTIVLLYKFGMLKQKKSETEDDD